MKKLMLLVLAGILMILAGCPTPMSLYPVTIKIDDLYEKRYNLKMLKTQAIVPGFEQVYDSIRIDITNVSNNTQYFIMTDQPEYIVRLPKGIYNFLAYTPDADSIESYAHFTTNPVQDSVSQTPRIIELQTLNKQSLILVDKTTVDGVPVIRTGNTVGLMSIGANYYYAYVIHDLILQYSVGGSQAEQPITVTPRKIYTFSAASGTIKIGELYDEVINV